MAEPTSVTLRNIKAPNEKVCLSEERDLYFPRTDRKTGKKARQFTGETVSFVNTTLTLTDEDAIEQVLTACPYVHVEPEAGEAFVDERTGFRTYAKPIYDEWMNSIAREDMVNNGGRR